MLVAKYGAGFGSSDRYVDLRVDDHATPLDELSRLLAVHRHLLSGPGTEVAMRAEGNVVRELQRVLAKQGYYAGPLTTSYDAATREAFRRFCDDHGHRTAFDATAAHGDNFIPRAVLNQMREQWG